MTTNKPPSGATCTDQQHETHVLSKHDSHTKTNQTSGSVDRPSERRAFPAAGGWLQETSLLYRLTSEAKPRNCDEISVTQANGSRSIEARTLLASELLGLLRKSATELIAVDVCQASSGSQNDNDLKALIDRLDGLRDSVDDFRDAGPVGSGWKSGELIDQIAALDEAIRTLRIQKSATDSAASSDSCADCEPGASVYAACYTSCIHESSMKTLSLHASRSCAESAVAEHKRAQRALYDEWADEKYQAAHPWSDQKGSGSEAWAIDEFEVLP